MDHPISGQTVFDTRRSGAEEMHIPLKQLTRAAAEPLGRFGIVAVRGSSSTEALQACIRLKKVYGMQQAVVLTRDDAAG